MTTAIHNLKNNPDYLELRGSLEFNTSSQSSKHPPSSTATTEQMTVSFSKDDTNMSNMTSKNNNDQSKLQNVPITHTENKSRPLPKVNETVTGKDKPTVSSPPYYNLHNASAEVNVSKFQTVAPLSIYKRPSYIEVPQLRQTNPEMSNYSKLNSEVDHYELLAPAQSAIFERSNANFTNQQHQSNLASKKFVSMTLCCILVGLAVVLTASLTATLVVGNQIDNSFNSKLSSVLNLQAQSNSELLDNFRAMCSSYDKASQLTVNYADSCYCLYREKLSWNDARNFCLTRGNFVHLAEIYTKEENDFLMPILQASQPGLGIWLGGSDLARENYWVWNYTGKPIDLFKPSQWGSGQPSSVNNIGQDEHCLDVYNWSSSTFLWNDHTCHKNDLKPFLCKSSLTNSRCFC